MDRAERDRVITTVTDYSNESGESEFAGLYVDEGLEVVYCLYTGNLDLHKTRLVERGCPPERVSLRQVAYSLAQLNELHARVDQDLKELRSKGIVIVGVGTDLMNNQVTIELQSFDDRTAEDLRQRYGEPIRVIPATGSGCCCAHDTDRPAL